MFKLKFHSINAVVCLIGLAGIFSPASAQKKDGKESTKSKPSINENPVIEQVTIPYRTQKKEDIIGAVSVVADSKIKGLTPVSVDALLQGQVAGLQVVNVSGAPGAGALTNLRGNSTINGGSLPLYIVDGIPIKTYRFNNPLAKNVDNNPLADLNPNDIASITVLKDAYATALYGMRGANGVIIISTYGGTAGKTYLDFSGYTGAMGLNKDISVLDGDQYRSFILAKENARGLSQFDIDKGVGRYMLTSTSPDQVERYNNNTIWKDEVSRTGIYNNYHLKLRGGDAVAKYSLNVGYTNQQGLINQTDYDRFTTRFNLDYRVRRKLTTLNTISYTRSNKNVADEGNSFNYNPLYLASLKSPNLASWRQDLNGLSTGKVDSVDFIGRNNPYAVVNNMQNANSTNRILGSITAQYAFSPLLTLSTNVSADFIRLNENRFRPSIGFAPEDDILRSASENNSSEVMVQNENILSYNRYVSKVSKIKALIGNTIQATNQKNEFAIAINSPSDEFTSISTNNPLLIDSIASYEPNWKLMSYFGSIQYDYKGKYYFGADLRADGSSRFAKGKRWGYFPAVAAAWKISSEPFFKKNKFINDLKLRLSYGMSGNQEVGYYGSYNALVPANYNNQPGVRLGMIGNPDYTWEKTTQLNAGLDLSIFNKLTITADVYNKETSDLLNYISLPGISGFKSYVLNEGKVRNKGLEIGISGRLLTGKLGWNTNLSAAYNKNEILSRPDNQDAILNYGAFSINSSVGNAIGSFYGYNAIGVYKSTSDVTLKNGVANVNQFQGGDIIFEDINKDNVIDESDRKVLGKSSPDVYGGYSNIFTYKGFDLNVFVDFAFGQDIYNAQRAALESMSNYDNQSTTVLNRWKIDGDISEMPRVLHGDAVGNTRFSSRWIEDGSFIRFKNISLGYKFPIKENKGVFKNARVVLSAQNLHTISKYKGYSPEVGSITTPIVSGVDYGSVPQLRSFILGVQLGL